MGRDSRGLRRPDESGEERQPRSTTARPAVRFNDWLDDPRTESALRSLWNVYEPSRSARSPQRRSIDKAIRGGGDEAASSCPVAPPRRWHRDDPCAGGQTSPPVDSGNRRASDSCHHLPGHLCRWGTPGGQDDTAANEQTPTLRTAFGMRVTTRLACRLPV